MLAAVALGSFLVGHRLSRRRDRAVLSPPAERETDVHRRVLENASELIAIVEGDGLRWASAACLRELGVAATELVAVRMGELVHPDDLTAVRAAWRNAVGGARIEGSFRLRSRAGDWRQLEATASSLGDGSVLVVARDVTERADAERRSQLVDRQLAQAEKMEAIGHLAAGVAHDFNNVLLAVRGYAELINWEAAASPTIRGFTDEITSVCERATGLTRQLLAFGRTQAMVPELLELNGVVIDTRRLLDPLLGENVVLHLELGVDVPAVSADRGQLEQSIVNLAVNAAQAMPDGGVLTISTTAVRVDGRRGPLALSNVLPGEYARLDVRDTGPGIDPDAQARIFEPFATADGRDTSALALSAVYGFVAQSGGHVAVESTPGAGACFSMLLPVSARAYAADRTPGDDPADGASRVA